MNNENENTTVNRDDTQALSDYIYLDSRRYDSAIREDEE